MESVDRNAREMSDGSPEDPNHREIDPNTGMQKGYIVLSAEERAKGFVRPLRNEYTHVGQLIEVPGIGKDFTFKRSGGCGTNTRMGDSIAETYARDPGFYSGTFCVGCRKHFPLNEFVWKGTNKEVGS